MTTVATTVPWVADAAWHETAGPWRWRWLLARWALLRALSTAALIGAFGALAAAAGPVPAEQLELLGAVQAPVVFRLTAALDGLTWLTIGAILLVCARLFVGQAPIRATFLAVCGVGQVVGLLGAYLNLQATGELGARYAGATPEQQAAILQTSLTLFQTISAHYDAATLLYGAGYLLIAWLVFSLGGLPRWLGAWFALSGIRAGISQIGLVTTGDVVAQGLFFALLVAGVVADLAIAVTLWRAVPPSQHADR
jgi:Domain of unknown function (DUF4386)